MQNKSFKIATVIGARPQFIKAAVVTRALRRYPDVAEVLIHTGQHYDLNMSQMLIEELDLPNPAYNLGIGSAGHGVQTGRMMESIEGVLSAEHPDAVLVYGDTNSTLAGALVASKLHIPIAHVEAGVRSFNKFMPEEINRIVTDHISDLLFAPTYNAVSTLVREGIPAESIFQVGDVMYDAAIYYGSHAARISNILERLELTNRAYILVTLHRAENTDDLKTLRRVLQGLRDISKSITIVFPVHPRTRKIFEENDFDCVSTGSLFFVPAVLYLDMIMLEKNARIIVTDSGGVQKEAFFYRVPCITLRKETEWIELVQLGWNRLETASNLPATVRALCEEPVTPPAIAGNPFGDGNAAEKIVAAMLGHLRAVHLGGDVRSGRKREEGDRRSPSWMTA